MTTPVSNISRTNIGLLDPNLTIGLAASPSLQKNVFDEIYNYFDTFATAYNAFIANGGIATANLSDLSVTTAKLALLAVTAAQIADGTITTGKIADGAVTSAKILDGAIATADLADAIITTAKLALLSVTTAQLADNSVTSAKIVDGTIATSDIADSAITSAKIADGTIVNADINAAAAIDGSKLANLSITSSQIADGTIMNVDINASAAIDASKIGAGVVSNTEFGYLDGVTSPIQSQINGVVLGSIPDGSLTDVKLDNGGTSIKARLTSHLADYVDHIPYGVAGGLVNAYTVTLSPALAAYTAGVALSVNINITNTGAATINVNGLGAKSILTSKGAAMTAGKLTAAGIYTLRYDGTNFILQGEGGGGNAQPADVLSGKTFTNDVNDQTGTIPVITGDTAGIVVNGVLTAGRLYIQPPPNSYWGNTGYYTYSDDANFVAANIVGSIFGLAGTARKYKSGSVTLGAGPTSQSIVLGWQPKAIVISTGSGAYSIFVFDTHNAANRTANSSPNLAIANIIATGFDISDPTATTVGTVWYEVWG